MRILLAMDDSQPSEAALTSVLTRPWPDMSEVRVLSVAPMTLGVQVPGPNVVGAPMPYAPVPLATDPQTQSTAFDTAGNIAQRACARLTEHGLRAESATRMGSPGHEIVEEAREWSADLVIVGSRGQSGLTRLLLGSTAHHVVNHAHCSVEIARAKESDAAQEPA